MLTTIHRFTPPTCTLEIKGKKSPLSRWTNKDTLKNFKFKLSFDDPRLSRDRQIVVTGDRFILEQLKTLVDRYIQANLHNSFIPNINTENSYDSNKNQPYLKSKGLTNHELFFGNLNHDSDENKVTLSTVQLFDLVTALEAYSNQINALPELEEQAKKAIPFVGGIAAVALLGVGITTTVIMFRSPIENIASSPQAESPNTMPSFDDVIPPETTPKSRNKNPQPKINESLSSAKRLPPPPAVSTPKPKPNIPDPADYPLSQVARQSGLKPSVKNEQTKEKQVESIISPSPKTSPEAKPNPEQKIVTPKDSREEFDLADANNNIALKDAPAKPSQAQEIKAYFQDKWQPPADLKQSLEYRLYLNPDGSIKRVVPIGKASELYLNKTNIPVRGETFISPLKESQKSTIRLLLNPNGEIKTFYE